MEALSYGILKDYKTYYRNHVIQEVAAASFLEEKNEVHREKATYSRK